MSKGIGRFTEVELRLMEVVLVTNACSIVIVLLFTVKNMCPVSGLLPVQLA